MGGGGEAITRQINCCEFIQLFQKLANKGAAMEVPISEHFPKTHCISLEAGEYLSHHGGCYADEPDGHQDGLPDVAAQGVAIGEPANLKGEKGRGREGRSEE